MDTLRKKKGKQVRQAVGDPLDVVERDKVTKTDTAENKRRRTIILEKQHGSWGFTLQTYGIHNTFSNTIEDLTYVDYVEFGGAGYNGGMRPGDVILSINGTSVETLSHKELVQFIRSCQETMRMVVLFEDCVRKVDLHLRFLKLKAVLQEKIFEFRALDVQERRLLQGLSPFETKSLCPSIDSSGMSNDDSTFDNGEFSTSNVEFKDLDLTDRSSLLNFYVEGCDDLNTDFDEPNEGVTDVSMEDFANYRARSISYSANRPQRLDESATHGAINSLTVNAEVHSMNTTSAVAIPKHDLSVCTELSAHSSCDENCSRTTRMTRVHENRLSSVDSIDSDIDQFLADSGFAESDSSPEWLSANASKLENKSIFIASLNEHSSNYEYQSDQGGLSTDPFDFSTLQKNLSCDHNSPSDVTAVELESVSLQLPTDGALSLCDFIRIHGHAEHVNEEEESSYL